jgi:maltose-binding protein MalE
MVSELPKDSAGWIGQMKSITKDEDGDGFPEVYGLVFNAVEPFWLVPFIGGYGGWIFDEDFNPTLDTPEMTAALKFMADLRNVHKVFPKECNYELSDTMFKNGQAAYLINGPWSFKGYLDAGMDIGVIPIPVITGTGLYPAPMVSSKGYSINANVGAKKLPLVKELLAYLTSEEVQKEIVEELLILPSLSSLYRDESLRDNAIVAGSMDQAGYGRQMPAVPEMRAVWDAIRPFYQSVLGGQLQPAEASARMQERAIKKIEEMKK